MKRDTQQKSSVFLRDRTAFLLGISLHFWPFVVGYGYSRLSQCLCWFKELNLNALEFLKYLRSSKINVCFIWIQIKQSVWFANCVSFMYDPSWWKNKNARRIGVKREILDTKDNEWACNLNFFAPIYLSCKKKRRSHGM